MPGFGYGSNRSARRGLRGAGGGGVALAGLVIQGDSQTSTVPETPSTSFWSYNWKTNHSGVTPCAVVAQASRTIGGAAWVGPPAEGADGGSPAGNTLLLHRPEDMARNAKALFVMIGSNDLGTFSVANFLARLSVWAAPIRAAGTKIFLCTPPPYDSRHVNMAVFNPKRLDYLTQIRANWASYVDALVPFGDHPDLNTGVDPHPLIQDGVHLTAYNGADFSGGQNRLYDVADAALSSFFDASRDGATAPYPGSWFGADSVVGLNEVVTRRYIVSGLGTGVVANCSISGAGTFRRGFAAQGTAGFTVVNGDVIEVQMTGSAVNSTPVTATVTIGSASDTVTLTTIGVAAQQVVYSQAGAFTSAASATSQSFATVTIAAGIPVVVLTSYATAGGANNAEPATVTLVPTGGGATTTLTQRLRQIRGTAASRAASLYSGAAELPAGSYTVALNGRAFAAVGTVIEVGTLQNADPVPFDAQGNTPTESSVIKHATPSVVTPSLGLALAFYFVEDTITPTAVTVDAPATLIDNTTASVTGATDGLGFATRQAGTAAVSFNHKTGTYARGIVVFKASGS